MQQYITMQAIMFDSATHPINVGTCAHNIFCFGGQVINHKYPKHKEVEGLERSPMYNAMQYIFIIIKYYTVKVVSGIFQSNTSLYS